MWLSRWNGDEIAGEIVGKVEQKGKLTDEDLPRLVMLPFMKSDSSIGQRVMGAVQMANKLVDQGKKDSVMKLMTAMAGRLVSDTEYNLFVQAFRESID